MSDLQNTGDSESQILQEMRHLVCRYSRFSFAGPTQSRIKVTAHASSVPEAIDGERKTVTALFADIKGSTELMEDLDPEEARAIIDPALKLMIDAVHRYDGYVVQSTGDGIFALFGAPVAHEDHPQRALYAALRMQEELKRYSAKVRRRRRNADSGRASVSTRARWWCARSRPARGRPNTRRSGTPPTSPRGCRPRRRSVRSRSAKRRASSCEGYFILKPLGATKVKGVSEPVNVYEVTGLGPLRTRLQRSAGRGLTKFVGREREMEALKHAAEQAKSGHGQIVAAMAEPGVGKSRLFFEFKATSQSGWMVLETFSVSHGKASAYLPVIDLLRNYFEIRAKMMNERRREKVHGKIARPGSRARRYHSLSVQPARHRRGRRSAGADGRADQEAAHAGGDQTHPAAREPQSAADGDLRGPPLDRRSRPRSCSTCWPIRSGPRRSCCW